MPENLGAQIAGEIRALRKELSAAISAWEGRTGLLVAGLEVHRNASPEKVVLVTIAEIRGS